MPDVSLRGIGSIMSRRFWALVNTGLFTIIVPGTVAILIPRWLLGGGYVMPASSPTSWLGALLSLIGAAIYFRCAWEFAVRGLGTPAPIAPTQFLVTTALHRYVRNPMYLGVAIAILGQAVFFRSLHVAEFAVVMLLIAHVFVVLYEEPTLERQFGKSYEEYRRMTPRWVPRLRAGRQNS
jgi:protein-S-isoprenylcysteine O-methyltransferase Ste14